MPRPLLRSPNRIPFGLQLLLLGLSTSFAAECAGLLLPAVGLGDVAAYPVFGNTLCRQVTVAGLFAAASGLLHWGVLGIRRRGPRPGRLLLTGLSGWFFLGHLTHLLDSYRTLFLTERFHFASGMALYKSALVAKIVICAALPLSACLAALLAHSPERRACASTGATGRRRLLSILPGATAAAVRLSKLRQRMQERT